jgi:hypothetical protein
MQIRPIIPHVASRSNSKKGKSEKARKVLVIFIGAKPLSGMDKKVAKLEPLRAVSPL